MVATPRFHLVDEYHDRVDDDDIRERLRDGDIDALQLLRRRHGDAMRDACFKILHHDSQAEDAVVDALLLAWKYRAKVVGAKTIRNYVVQISRNVAYDFIRKAARRRGIERANAAMLEPNDAAGGTPSDRAAHAALAACLEALEDPRTRVALSMRVEEGSSWAEIAEALDPPREAVDTVRMRVRRALRVLRECLAGKGVTS